MKAINKSVFRGSSIWKKKRNEIIMRDGFKCAICQCTKNLQVHHIYSLDNYPNMKLENNNLITLCDICHHKAHNGMYSPVFLLNKIK